jgi:hypothetical protein
MSLLLTSSRSASAYSVLTHEQLIDQSWKSTIAPILISRFPSLTPEQLAKAHAYAYGGCAIQDLGYYPSGNAFFSELTHYVRSGDFVQSLFRNAHNADELAFAIGALAHYIGDTIGHAQATNPSVAIAFPKLRSKYGSSESYEQAKNAHGEVEFAFDINQIVKQRFAPSAYLRFIGLAVPRRQLNVSFYETYGLYIAETLGLYRTTLHTYSFGVRTFLPAFAYAEALLHGDGFPADTPGPELSFYEQHMAQLAREAEWDRYRKKPGLGIHLLAGLIVILPKIGPIKMLAIKGPNAETEKRYIESVNLSTGALTQALASLSAPLSAEAANADSASPPYAVLPSARYPETPRAGLVPNRDLDTGVRILPGGYHLTDETYAKLLAMVTKDQTRPLPAALKQDILSYYADPDAPISTKRNPKKWAQVQQDLQRLTTFPTRTEPE